MHMNFSKSQFTKQFHSLKHKLSLINSLLLQQCFGRCSDHTTASGAATRVWNTSDRHVEVQIRVGSILKRVHTLKPGCSKRLKGKNIYKAYMPSVVDSSNSNLMCCFDDMCRPYVWVHDPRGDFSRMVKEQYVSLEDLRECSEIRVLRDHQRGCIVVKKKQRPDFC